MGEPVTSSRRSFINWFLGTSAGALMLSVAYPAFRFLSPPRIPEASVNQVEAGPTNDADFVDKGFKIIRFGLDPVIVIKLAESEFRAFSATCTHLDCIVTWEEKKTRIFCNCHNGIYDINGRNVGGPPPRPLTAYKVDLVTKGASQPATVVVSKA